MIISDYAIKFRTAVMVLIVVLVVAGVVSYRVLPREGAPDITIPFVFVTVIYEGTAPEDMENLVVRPLERQLIDADNLSSLQSRTLEGVATISLEFISGSDIDMARQHVKDKIDLARPDLPSDLDEPVVQAFNFSTDYPIFIFALSGGELDRLKYIAEDLQEQIELVPGVRQAGIAGTREREIRVEVDLNRLIAYDVPMGHLIQRIADENINISAGHLEVAGNRFQVRVPGEYTLATDLRDILIAQRDGAPFFLRDLAEVSDTYKDLSSISRLNGAPSISLEIRKRNRENSVVLINEVKRIIHDFGIPSDVAVTYVMDQSEYIDMMISELENNIVTGFLLVVCVIFLFMGLRNSLFVAVAIPLSMLIAFTIMNLRGATLNMIVLFSLVLALGMLVDNAIVIVENIYRLRTTGLSRRDAARQGASEVAWPVITSTVTTCMAFAPLLFWPDIMGQFMSFLPLTLITTLGASLFVALVINPALCSIFIAKRRGKPEKLDAHGVKDSAFVRAYESLLRGAVHHRLAVLFMALLFLFASVEFYMHLGRGVELFPEVDPRNATINVEFPQGTAIERTDDIIRRIEALLPEYADIEFFLATVGQTDVTGFTFGPESTNVGQVFIEFVPYNERQRSSMDLISEIRQRLPVVPGALITIERQEEGPPTGEPVAIEVYGDDFDELAALAARIMRAIESVPGLVDLQSDFEEALPELQFEVARHRAALLGLDTRTVGMFLRTAVFGTEASRFRPAEDEFDITLRLPLQDRDTVELLDRIFIPVPGGDTVPLSSLGTVRYAAGRGAITRKDQRRMITITGNNHQRGVNEIIQEIGEIIDRIPMERGYSVAYTGDTEEMEKSGRFLAQAFLIAIGLILIILVIQFNSVFMPLIIGVSVLLSLIGVMWGLILTGTPFGVIMTGMGVVSLAGIVVNNSIVLMDCIRQRQADGLPSEEAVIVAGKMRLRPVLLTAITTILGLLPMAIGLGIDIHHWPPRIAFGAETSAWWAPMAVAVIFGLAMATLLTLVLVPVMFSLFDTLSQRLKRRFPAGQADD